MNPLVRYSTPTGIPNTAALSPRQDFPKSLLRGGLHPQPVEDFYSGTPSNSHPFGVILIECLWDMAADDCFR